jgi:uncharacterized protein
LTLERLTVHAKPGSRKPGVEKLSEREWTVRVREPATEGKANAAILRAVARELGLPPSALRLVRGEGARTKLLEFERT